MLGVKVYFVFKINLSQLSCLRLIYFYYILITEGISLAIFLTDIAQLW